MLAVFPIFHRVIRVVSEGLFDDRPRYAPIATFEVVIGEDAEKVVPAFPFRPDWVDDLYAWLDSSSWLRLLVFLRDID